MTQEPEMRVKVGIIQREPVRNAPSQVFNLTKHFTSWEERKMGVIEPGKKAKADISALLSFSVLPDQLMLDDRAHQLAGIAKLSGCKKALIGGPSFFMSTLEMALCYHGIEPVFVWLVKNEKGRWKFGAFVESVLVEKGWMDLANRT
jgi:hypothetical protein